jgi:hypothetical protein
MKKISVLFFLPILVICTNLQSKINLRQLHTRLIKIKSKKNNKYFAIKKMGTALRLEASADSNSATIFRVITGKKKHKNHIILTLASDNKTMLSMSDTLESNEIGGLEIQLKGRKKGWEQWWWLDGNNLSECYLRGPIKTGVFFYTRGRQIKVREGVGKPIPVIKLGTNPNPFVAAGTSSPGSMTLFGPHVDKEDLSLKFEIANPIPDRIINKVLKNVRIKQKSSKQYLRAGGKKDKRIQFSTIKDTRSVFLLKKKRYKKSTYIGLYYKPKKRYIQSRKDIVQVTGKKLKSSESWRLYSFENEPLKNTIFFNKSTKECLTSGPNNFATTRNTYATTKDLTFEIEQIIPSTKLPYLVHLDHKLYVRTSNRS